MLVIVETNSIPIFYLVWLFYSCETRRFHGQGRSALHLASANGALGAVKALLQAHATPVPWIPKGSLGDHLDHLEKR